MGEIVAHVLCTCVQRCSGESEDFGPTDHIPLSRQTVPFSPSTSYENRRIANRLN